jgi:ankyrin repeat protein
MESTPLHLAALNEHFEIVKYLVEKGANIQAKTVFCETPLKLADIRSKAEIITFLKDEEAKK